MSSKSLYIAVPEDYDDLNWQNQILGELIKPTLQKFSPLVKWMWVTNYLVNNNSLPQDHKSLEDQVKNNYVRYSLLRVEPKIFPVFVFDLIKAYIQKQGFIIRAGWEDYDYVADLGGNRFIYKDASKKERENRARLILQFMYVTLRLRLDSLIKDQDGQWNKEVNSDELQNPEKDFFQSLHHLFHNITNTPVKGLVRINDFVIQFATNISRSYNIMSTHYKYNIKSDEWYSFDLYY